MKIVEVQEFPIVLKGDDNHASDSGTGDLQTIIIRVRTDAGLYGLGEAPVSLNDRSRNLPNLLNWLRAYGSALVGSDALNVNWLHQKMDEVSGQHPPGCQAARAAIDIAVHDLIGKKRGCPVYEILGGAYRTELELMGHIEQKNVEAAVSSALQLVSQGYRGLLIDLCDDVLPAAPAFDKLAKKAARLRAVLEAVEADISIDADANQSFGNPSLVSRWLEDVFSQRFYSNLSLRQPLQKDDFLGHAALREKLPVSIVLAESVGSVEAAMQIERLSAADRLGVSLERVGGLDSAMRIAAICEAAAMGLSPSTEAFTKIGRAAACHFAAALHSPYPVDLGAVALSSSILIKGGPVIANGKAKLGNAPGLGIEIDEMALRSANTPSALVGCRD